jgi:adenylate cyclase
VERGTDETASPLERLGLAPDQADAVDALTELGISVEAMRRALDRGRLEDAVFDVVLDPERAGASQSPREVEAAGGLSIAQIAEFMLAFGLPTPDPDEPYFTDDEAAALVELADVSEIWPPRLYTQAARVYGQALSRIARTELGLFRLQLERDLQDASDDASASLAAVRTAFERLLPIADTMLVGVHRRWVAHELAAAAAFEAVERIGEQSVPGGVRVTILFLDLKDFTAYADTHGDAAAVAVVDRFARAVYEQRGEGEIVKALGDGYMLAYPAAGDAIAAARRITGATRDGDVPAVHASAHTGAAILRDGDYLGSAVNIAARLLSQSVADELLATRQTAEATDTELAWESRGKQPIRGLKSPIEVVSLRL